MNEATDITKMFQICQLLTSFMADLHVFFLFFFFSVILSQSFFLLAFLAWKWLPPPTGFHRVFFVVVAILTSCNVARTCVHSDNEKFIPKNNTEQENTFDWLCRLSNQNKLKQVLCDVRFLVCSSSLTLIKCAALRWTNRRIIDGAIRNNCRTEWD